MTKKQLYETIMRNVSHNVKKVLNEDFNFEPAEAMNAIVNAFNDERLSNIVSDAACENINELVKEIAKMATTEMPSKAPLKISSIKQLAAYILVKHFNEAAIKEITEMGKPELDDLANCVCSEVLGTDDNADDNNADDNTNNNADNSNDIENRQQYNNQMNKGLPSPQKQLPECNKQQKTNECNCGNGNCNTNKKPANESYGYSRNHRLNRIF